MALSNVTVATADVKKFQPDVEDYLFTGQSLSDVVQIVKRSIERDIQLRADLTDSQVALIKDTAHAYLYDKIIQHTLAEIYLQNNLLDKAEIHRRRGESVPLRYYVDEDEDGVEDEGEKDIVKTAFFGR